MRTFLLFILCAITVQHGFSQNNIQINADANLLQTLMQTNPVLFKPILDNQDSLRVQIIYTQINRDKKNRPSFKEYSFNLNKNNYFYPASTVKMPIAFLALEKLNELKIAGLTKTSTMITDSGFTDQDHVYNQPNAVDGIPTIENYIKQIFLVSDNDAFNRLYEFLGSEYIQRKLSEKGYPDAIIRHRLQLNRTPEQNSVTNPIQFYDSTGKLLYSQPMQKSKTIFPELDVFIGKGYLSGGKLVNAPYPFVTKNRVYLQDLHHILQSVMFPAQSPKKSRFNFSKADYTFLYKWMSSFPKQSEYPHYDTASYWDAYCKFLLYGSAKGNKSPRIKIFNKVGDAYGFLIDVAYIVDLDNNIEFMLSAAISCNTDGIFNDDNYDYDRIGFPFMKNIGEAVYQYELKRIKNHVPCLSKWQ